MAPFQRYVWSTVIFSSCNCSAAIQHFSCCSFWISILETTQNKALLCYRNRKKNFIMESCWFDSKHNNMGFPVAQTVKNLAAVKGTLVQSMVWKDLLEKGMDTHSSILAWRFPQTEEPGGLQSMGSQRVGHNWATNTHIYTILQVFDANVWIISLFLLW